MFKKINPEQNLEDLSPNTSCLNQFKCHSAVKKPQFSFINAPVHGSIQLVALTHPNFFLDF